MHEASIAMNIIEVAERHCRAAGYQRVDAIALRIGKASGVLPEALKSAFEIVRLESMASGAVLTIDEVPIGGKCGSCKVDFITEEPFLLACPECGSRDFRIERGRELDIIDIEVN